MPIGNAGWMDNNQTEFGVIFPENHAKFKSRDTLCGDVITKSIFDNKYYTYAPINCSLSSDMLS